MQSEGTAAFTTGGALRERLARAGEHLAPEARSEILALGAPIIPDLINIVADDELAMEEALGNGWMPIHAVDLLIDLKAEEAAPTLLSVLVQAHWESILHNKIAVRLPELGRAVFEPGAALMETLEDEEGRSSLCGVLAQLGVRDDRLFAWCLECFEREPVIGSVYFGYYGDEQALPIIRQAIEDFEPDWDSPLGFTELADFVDAYERIAGGLPTDLADHVTSLRQAWEDHSDSVEPAEEQQPHIAAPKVGRNDPCPCGSGKKFKKCCSAQ